MRRKAISILAVWAGVVFGRSAPGLINPNYTPVQLVRDAELILVLELMPPAEGERIETRIKRCLKGNAPARPPLVDLSDAREAGQARRARELIASLGKGPAVLIGGKGERGEAIHFLHLQGRWLALRKSDENTWSFTHIEDTRMPAVWAGGTDMLVRIMDLILSQGRTRVPVVAGSSWSDDQQNPGTVAGKAVAAGAVDLRGDGRLALYVGAGGGDRLFQYDPRIEKFVDLTEKVGLEAKSRAAAWGDFNADGRLDLASWDGRSLNLLYQDQGGNFATQTCEAPPAGCLGLVPVGMARRDRPGLIWSGPAGPVLLAPDPEKGLRPAGALDPGGVELSSLGRPGTCLAADFDGDSWPDVLWVCEKGSLLFRGSAGGFQGATSCNVALGSGRGGAFPGDYDADGLLDVFALSRRACLVWQNRGRGRFEESLSRSGEIEHVYSGGGLGGNTCDFNNDGLQDIFITSAAGRPLLFFNRGFRSFGHAHSLDLLETRRLPESHQGQQAGVVADLDGDGAQDVALVLPGGGVWVVFQDWQQPPLALRVALKQGRGFPGPITVTGWDGKRCLGAWNLTAGASEAFFGKRNKGPLTIRWRLPGGAGQSRTVIVLKSMRIALSSPSG
jgi:hypothetical protein